MKPFLASLALVLLIIVAPVVHAQTPVQDTIPQLKEWWRADDMKYGKYGMTWLDNFYNGKGALVVWTPNGVQTWQLRFPGDTQNVFTWAGGSAAIRTGDFNGDGITDYLDGKGDIYEGIQNGELPKLQPTGKGFYPDLVIDLNGDGYDDMFYPEGYVLGGANLKELQSKIIKFPEIDSNNVVLLSYIVSTKEIRVLCRHYYWTNLTKFPFGKVYKEGLRLIGLHWEGDKFRSSILDEFTVSTPDSTGILYTGALLSQPPGKNYFICATMIKGTNQHNDVSVYDISNDRLAKLYSTQIDSISTIGVLQYSINNDTIPDWYIRNFQKNGYSPIKFYSGNIENKAEVIGEYTICQRTFLSSVLFGGNSLQQGVALSGNDGSCFRIVTLNDMVTVEGKEIEKLIPFSIESITPQPVCNKQTIQVKLSIPIQTIYEVSIYSLSGNKLYTFTSGQSINEQQTLAISLAEYNLSTGFYWLTLKVGKNETHTKLIVN